ncbi:P-type ATPase, translocating [Synechococcus sp. PCC 7502]|uniref:HAD-IC family P-type ATPase n=1 Tax=Synechococcus sp. PCC 7502 TaxID=1173263 RepID=UPI00029FE869|nr:HAD-IC family P-type ATPase [Synechococcus sp. PCC 7502]AFY72182.1 P-type ATPase, translocating [Synechococcus sp. PCC 7502]
MASPLSDSPLSTENLIPENLSSADLIQGLTTSEVSDRVASGDVNVVVFRSTRTYGEIFKENIFTLFHISFGIILSLLAALGQSTDALFSGVTILSNIVVGVFQEVKAKLSLDKLALLSVQQVTVRRDGVSLIIPLGEVVRDDVIELKPGDRAPVDGEVLVSESLEMDESLLTGESDPVDKQVGDTVLSGSFCGAGSGLFRAVKIGNESYANQITQTSRVYKRSLTPLQKKINAVVEIFVFALLVAGFLHLIASLNSGRTPVDTLRYAAVIVNSFVPAGLVLSISVALALGAVEISKQQTLIQRINAVDSMNSVRILCTDKTGTLTKNHLVVQEIIPLAQCDRPQLTELIALYVALVGTHNSSAKAMEAFIGLPKSLAKKQSEVPFSSARKWGAITLEDKSTNQFNRCTIIVGSPEILLTDPRSQALALEFARQGIRVLAVVTCQSMPENNQALPETREDRGLVLLKDELRADVIDTIADLEAKGIEIKVISGDSVDTVAAIAQQAGIKVTPDTMFAQSDLDKCDPSKFGKAAMQGKVFGRITPDTKRRLIKAMVKQGSYVAMVGDGVNDVPAFKEAQLAIAMNDGAQISKDVADIILLNNSLATLPQAFEAGDQIKQKILASALLYLTKNIMVILTISFVGFVQLPFPIEPRQLTVLTFFLVSIPTILISVGILKVQKINNFLKDVLGYSFLAGFVGAVAMSLGYMLAYFGSLGLLSIDSAVSPEDFKEIGRGQAQAVSIMISIIYSLLVFWDTCQISVWRPRTIFKFTFPVKLGILIFVCATVMIMELPDLFQISLPDRLGWSLILFLPFTANYLLRMIQCSKFLRQLPIALTQP